MDLNANVRPMSPDEAMTLLRGLVQVIPNAPEVCDGEAVCGIMGEDGENVDRIVCLYHDEANGSRMTLEIPVPPASTTEEAAATVAAAIEHGRRLAVAKAWAVFN